MATVLVLGLCLAPGLEASKVDLLQLPRRAGQASVRTDSVGGGGDPTPFTIIAGLQMQFSEIFNTVSNEERRVKGLPKEREIETEKKRKEKKGLWYLKPNFRVRFLLRN